MPGRSPLVATAEQKAALQELSRSDVRGEADRVRAILLVVRPAPGTVSTRIRLTDSQARYWTPQGPLGF